MNIINLYNGLSKELVWEYVDKGSIKKASIVEQILGETERKKWVWGIGLGMDKKNYCLDFYISSEFDKIFFEKNLKYYGVLFRRRYIKTRGFNDLSILNVSSTLKGGDAVKHYKLKGYGSLGGFLSDKTSNFRLAISNNHVFAYYNSGKKNDSLLRDTDNSKFGGLHKYVSLKKPPLLNYADVAGGWVFDDQKLKWGWKKPNSTAKVVIGQEVYKIGATTGYTEGIVQNPSTNINVNYRNLGNLFFADSIAILGKAGRPFSLAGDSGSFVFTKSHKLIGILFAGDNIYSFVNKISNVENNLGVYL
jgi:hypothetical protein